MLLAYDIVVAPTNSQHLWLPTQDLHNAGPIHTPSKICEALPLPVEFRKLMVARQGEITFLHGAATSKQPPPFSGRH